MNSPPTTTTWDKKEWIKDVLSKSGTDIVEIKDENSKELRKMVYYPSLPLITKPDHQHQQRQQLCSPLNGETQIYHLQSSQQLQQPQHQSGQLHLMQSSSSLSHNGHHQNGTTTTLLIPSNQNYTKLETRQQQQRHQLNPNIEPSNSNGHSSNTNSSSSSSSSSSSKSSNNRQQATVKPQFKCDQCNMIFGSKSAHTSHIKSHKKITKDNNNFTLASSPSTATTTAQLLLNNSRSSPDLNQQQQQQIILLPNSVAQINNGGQPANGGSSTDPYQCNVCQKTFAVPARLIRHYRTHTGERPFECEFCHKMFSVKENLQVHRRIHTKERPYKCDVCGRAFEHSGKLHRHMRIHTGERPHKCSVCSKTFIQSGQLVIHMRTHTGEKPYKCPVVECGKGFTCSKQLKVHSRTHTGEKPYHCDICFRDFGYNHVLKLHKVQHYGSKCYKCTICDETFKNKKEMEAHIKGHANELPDDEDDEATVAQQEQPDNSQSDDMQNSTETIMASKQQQQQQQQQNIKQETLSRFTVHSTSSRSSESSAIPETEKSRDSFATIIDTNSPPPITISPHLSNHHHQQQQQHLNTTEIVINYDNDFNISQDNETIGGPIDNDVSTKYNRTYHHQRFEQSSIPQNISHPTINPALLAAASIASRRVEEANNLRMGMTSPPPTSLSNESTENSNEALNEYYKMRQIEQQQQDPKELDDDYNHRNQPIDCYAPVEEYRYETLVRQRTYFAPVAPVAEFKPSLRHNDIVRQVEAAIAGAGLSPPRSTSTESPEERSSSPESDTMLMADRDVMTLPLRKRKLYMNENQSSKDVPIVRMSSVIQFAKAS